MLNKNYVFVHIPKSGGATLKLSVESLFIYEDIVSDYSRPFSRGYFERNAKNTVDSFLTRKIQNKLIFGHFMPCKYCDLTYGGFRKRENSVYLTFLRDPLQRAISHYYFWKRTPDLNHKVCDKFLEEDWSLEKFLISPFFKNLYAQFFWGFNINNFDFIGITEQFDDSIKLLKKAHPEFSMLNIKQNVNINSEKQMGRDYDIDPDLASIFMKNNELDYRIYEKAVTNLNRALG